MPDFDLKNATLKVIDGDGTPHELEAKIGEGTLSFTEKFNRIYRKNRGKLDRVKKGDEEPIDVSFDFVWEYLTAASGSGVPTIREALLKLGEAAAWVSTDPDTCAPYAVDLEIELIPDCASEDKETILLQDFRVEQLQHNGKEATVAATGKCNVTLATITRAAQ